MQPVTLQRYLGNKSKLIPDILKIIETLAKPGDLVFDAFSGSLAVSIALKQANYRVASNDINLFSWVYGKAYLTNSSLPSLNFQSLGLSEGDSWQDFLESLKRPLEANFPKQFKRQDLFEHYCEEGTQSAFESSRGLKGRRRFLTSENAVQLDAAFSRLRFWNQDGRLDEIITSFITSILISAAEKVSNTQGTYHDFPRSTYDSRALKPLKLLIPTAKAFAGGEDHILGKQLDTLEFVKSLQEHQVIYIDPPYNFRQYTSYYFFPNLLASYPYLKDPDAYFSKIKFVRGQNMEEDFNSTFCSTRTFMPSLKKLIEDAKTKFVVMSYFDGKNHWSDFKSKDDVEGFEVLNEFFNSPLFKRGSAKCIPVARQNYQSYGGHKAQNIKEYLFLAEKS